VKPADKFTFSSALGVLMNQYESYLDTFVHKIPKEYTIRYLNHFKCNRHKDSFENTILYTFDKRKRRSKHL